MSDRERGQRVCTAPRRPRCHRIRREGVYSTHLIYNSFVRIPGSIHGEIGGERESAERVNLDGSG